MTDMIVRIVDGYGYLPIVEVDGKEVFRGSFKEKAVDALIACMEYVSKEELV